MSQYEIKTIKKNNLTIFINLCLELFRLLIFFILRFTPLNVSKISFIETLKIKTIS